MTVTHYVSAWPLYEKFIVLCIIQEFSCAIVLVHPTISYYVLLESKHHTQKDMRLHTPVSCILLVEPLHDVVGEPT